VSTEVAVALAGVTAGAVLQSATGFGFALIVAPVLTAAVGPRVAVPTATLTGLLVNGLTLVGEGRAPLVDVRQARVLLAASLPGMALGAVILATAPEDVLRVAIAAVVVGTVVLYVLTRSAGTGRSSPLGAGLVSGLLATTSGINGPPLVLHMRRVGMAAETMRDTLAAFFLVSAVLTLAALALAGAVRMADGVVWLLAGAVVGQAAGRLAFRQLEAHREAATLAVLALSAAAAVVPVVQALG
jgi:uncharacterized membrane protein YfcA